MYPRGTEQRSRGYVCMYPLRSICMSTRCHGTYWWSSAKSCACPRLTGSYGERTKKVRHLEFWHVNRLLKQKHTRTALREHCGPLLVYARRWQQHINTTEALRPIDFSCTSLLPLRARWRTWPPSPLMMRTHVCDARGGCIPTHVNVAWRH